MDQEDEVIIVFGFEQEKWIEKVCICKASVGEGEEDLVMFSWINICESQNC